MKRQEEVEAALVVVAVFAFAMLALLFILKWDDIVYFCHKRCCCCCFRSDTADSVHSYSNLNELLFDTDETRGGTLRILRTSDEGDFVVVEKETVTVDTFFSNVLSGHTKQKRETRTDGRAEEPLL